MGLTLGHIPTSSSSMRECMLLILCCWRFDIVPELWAWKGAKTFIEEVVKPVLLLVLAPVANTEKPEDMSWSIPLKCVNDDIPVDGWEDSPGFKYVSNFVDVLNALKLVREGVNDDGHAYVEGLEDKELGCMHLETYMYESLSHSKLEDGWSHHNWHIKDLYLVWWIDGLFELY